jgi:hypothetical protein
MDVNEFMINIYCSLYPLVYIHQKKIAAKIASANGQ